MSCWSICMNLQNKQISKYAKYVYYGKCEKCAKDAKYSEFAEYAQSADYKASQSSIHFFIFLLGVSWGEPQSSRDYRWMNTKCHETIKHTDNWSILVLSLSQHLRVETWSVMCRQWLPTSCLELREAISYSAYSAYSLKCCKSESTRIDQLSVFLILSFCVQSPFVSRWLRFASWNSE